MNDSTSAISISNYHKFAIEWAAVGQVLDRNATCRDSTDIPYCDMPENRATVEQFCHVIIDGNGPFAECHSYTAPRLAYRKCVMMGCLHRGNWTHACFTIRSYKRECQRCNKTHFLTIVPNCCKHSFGIIQRESVLVVSICRSTVQCS